MPFDFDLIVIGSGPAGEKSAVKAAYFNKKVALIEASDQFGGAGVVTGTLPSKTLKETSLFLSGKYEKGLYGVNRALEEDFSLDNFMYRKDYIITAGSQQVHNNLKRHGVTLYAGKATFIDEHTIQVADSKITAQYILIATGSYPCHPQHIDFDLERVHDSDSILKLPRFPKSLAILGAGVIGLEYATIFATLGVHVTIINRSDALLPFIDRDITAVLLQQMHTDGISFMFNQSVESIEKTTNQLHIKLSTTTLDVDMFLFAAGRNGRTKELALNKIGIQVDQRENIPVNSHYQTVIPHIYAAGDVVGFPALASTSMDQGRIAVAHMFAMSDIDHLAKHLPYGIYTIPEISTVGLTEQEMIKLKIPYEVGYALHNQLARGKIMGAKQGMLKLVVSSYDQTIQGVHIIGPLATELIHHGLSLVEDKKTLSDVIGNVYNFPTLHDLYKYAAYDALSHLNKKKI